MARKTKKELEEIKKKYNQSKIWSWSRYNCYKNSSYEYYLRYIKKEKPTRDSIYSYIGLSAHDIIEKFYNDEIKYEDMIDEFDAAYLNAELMDLKFHRTDDGRNENIAKKYNACIRHFFKNHKAIKENIVLEKYLLIKVRNFLFGGYFDAVHKDNQGNYIVTDWKTSSIYQGKKIDQEKGQLMLYAEGLRQLGIPLEKIKIRWNFLKYISITMPQKNGKMRTTNAERHAWFGKIKNNVKMWLKDTKRYADDEIANMLNYSLEFNTINNLPKDIQELYTINDCYVYIPFNQEEIDRLKDDIYKTLIEIYTKEKEYKETEDDRVWWETITDSQSYYFANLCQYNANQHKPYGEYLDKLEMGVDNEYKTNKNINDKENNSWMEELGLI